MTRQRHPPGTDLEARPAGLLPAVKKRGKAWSAAIKHAMMLAKDCGKCKCKQIAVILQSDFEPTEEDQRKGWWRAWCGKKWRFSVNPDGTVNRFRKRDEYWQGRFKAIPCEDKEKPNEKR